VTNGSEIIALHVDNFDTVVGQVSGRCPEFAWTKVGFFRLQPNVDGSKDDHIEHFVEMWHALRLAVPSGAGPLVLRELLVGPGL